MASSRRSPAVIDAKSPYTHDHSRRVAGYAVAAAERLGAADRSLVRLRRAALLHDIGKLGVPNSVLDKPGRLSDDEWALMRSHTQHTHQILDAVPVFRDVAFDAACHHERLDGSGYHLGLGGAALGPAARLLAVADVTDALTSDRPYRSRPGGRPGGGRADRRRRRQQALRPQRRGDVRACCAADRTAAAAA